MPLPPDVPLPEPKPPKKPVRGEAITDTIILENYRTFARQAALEGDFEMAKQVDEAADRLEAQMNSEPA